MDAVRRAASAHSEPTGLTRAAPGRADQFWAPRTDRTRAALLLWGGWSGSDPAPTLAEFQRYVAEGRVAYYVEGGMGGNSETAQWVAENYTAQTVGSTTVYDLRS